MWQGGGRGGRGHTYLVFRGWIIDVREWEAAHVGTKDGGSGHTRRPPTLLTGGGLGPLTHTHTDTHTHTQSGGTSWNSCILWLRRTAVWWWPAALSVTVVMSVIDIGVFVLMSAVTSKAVSESWLGVIHRCEETEWVMLLGLMCASCNCFKWADTNNPATHTHTHTHLIPGSWLERPQQQVMAASMGPTSGHTGPGPHAHTQAPHCLDAGCTRLHA